MEENLKTIKHFYDAFAQGDADSMLSCYHMEVQFKDPAFGRLNSQDVRCMWQMLLSRDSKPEITYSGEWADEKTGGVLWEAKYEFGKNKRKVHNKIKASFHFDRGKIIEHRDHFNFWKWSSMALGLPGTLLGWSPIIQLQVRSKVKSLLEEYKNNLSTS